MPLEHLSTDRLLALHDGAIEDFAALRHLASCSGCRRAFDDTRWTRLLSRLPELVAAGPHPGRDELTAFHTYALSSPRILEIERHLRACRVCLARAGRAREAERRENYRSPSPDVVSTTLERFRPRRVLQRLGTLLVNRLGRNRLMLAFVPEPTVAQSGGVIGFSGRPGHPASAKGRARRVQNRFEKHGLLRRVLNTAPADELAAEAAADSPDRSVRIPANGRELILTSSCDDGTPSLEVKLISTDDAQPASNVRLRVRRKNGHDTEVVTDPTGRALFPFEGGETEMLIDGDPRLVLRLDEPE